MAIPMQSNPRPRRNRSTRRKTSRPMEASWRYRALDNTGRFYEDTVTGDLIEYLTPEDAEAVQFYLSMHTFQAVAPTMQFPYFPRLDWEPLGGRLALAN